MKINIKNENRILKRKNKKNIYKYYVQDNNYIINEAIIGEKLNPGLIERFINYDALINQSIICCGIRNNNNFVEISYFENEYQLRIFVNGNESMETTDNYSEVNEIIYKNLV